MAALCLAIGAVAAGGTADACSLVSYSDNGRYLGGDLLAQVTAKADTIQIVKVSAKHLVSRTYTDGDWYLRFGDTSVPAGMPDYTDEFVFELDPVETLKIGSGSSGPVYENHLRIRGYGPEALQGWGEEETQSAFRPNALPDWLLERPGNDGYAFIGASDDAGLGGGECSSPYVLEVGQTLVAFRDSLGRLYPASGAFPLEIDVEFRAGRQKRRFNLNMQSLVPIAGPDDAFVAHLRQALAADRTR